MKKFLSLFAAVLLAGSVVADTFGLLTDASDLAAGDQIIIVNAEGTFAMSTTQNTNNRGLAAVVVEDNLIEPSANVQIITLEADGSNWKFNVGDDAYLYAASSSANHLKTNTAATVGDNGTWKITLDGEGVADIVAQGTNTRNYIMYNANSAIMSCYASTSTQAKCKIYKKGGTPQATVEYYLVGTMNSWEPATGYKFSKNTAAEVEEYKLDVTLEANAEFKGRKVVDGVADAWYPDGNDNNFVIETAGDYTIYLRPNGDGGDDWHYHVLYAEYHEPVVLPTITCADVNTADNGTAAKLNPVSVVYVGEGDAKYCYIADESGMTLLFKNGHGLAAGKLVSGIEGAVSIYSQLHEFVPSNTIADWTVTDEGVIPTFAEQTTAPAANQENQIIVLKGVFVDNTVTFSTTSVGSNVTAHIGEADFVMRNTFKVGMTLEQGKLYDITGAVSRYNSTIQFVPISAEEETVDPGTVEYYLAGWIGGADYAYGEDEASQSEYKFVNNRIVVNFDEDAYLLVRTYENTPKFYGADENVESEEENFEAVLADGGEGMVTIPANREATIQISLDESGAMTMSVALAHSYTCAEVNAAAHDEVINLNPATVAYLGAGDNRYCYLSDESGMTLLYKNGHGLEEGQLVSGLKGKLNIYNGLPELVPTNTIEDWTIGVGTMPEYAELTEAPGFEMVNQIVVLKNVSVAEDVTFTADAVNNANATIAGATIKLRNTFKVPMTLEASKMYDLTVAVARYARNETDEIQFFPIAAQEVDVPVVEKHYYLIGIDMWNVEALTEERELVLNEEAETVEYMIDWTLEQGNEFKIVEWDGADGQIWYPDGTNNNYVVDAAHAGPSTIYFRPLKDGGDDWHYNYIYVETHPVEHHYYLMGIDVWDVADLTEDRLLVKNEGTDANEYMINWTLAVGNEFQIVEWDGEEGQTWFPGGNANYVVDAAHAGAATIYFRPYRDGDEAWHEGCIYVYKYLGPTSKAVDPEWPALQVKAVYSDTYEADCNFGEWGSGTQYEQTEYGKHYTTTDLGYFGLAFEDRTLNCSKMEALHLDVWGETDMSMRVVPIYASDANMGITINITAGQWNSIELPFTSEEWANMGEHWSNIYQIKIDNARNVSFWLDNVYFYTSQVPEDDHDAPTGLQAQVVAASYFSAVIEAVAEDNSGEVLYSVVNGGLKIASGSGNSGVPVRITVNELQGGYEYHFNVVAIDPQGNDAEPVEITVNTLATPDPASQPEYAAEDVMSLYSAYYNPAVEFGYQDWWMGATQSEGDLAQNNFAMCYVPKDAAGACFGWAFAPTDVTAYDRFEMDVYAVEDGALDFALIGLTQRAVYPLQGGQWNHIVIDIAGNEKTNLEQLGFYDNQNSGTFFVQNVLFVNEPVVYNYFMVGDFCGWDLANAVMFEDVEGVLAAMIPSMTGKFKIVKCAGETAQWGDEFGAHTQGDVIALNPQGEYILKHNDSQDLKVEGRYNNAVFTLTESEGEMVLHFVAGTVDETIYFVLAGDWNSWNNNDDNATFQEVEGALRLEVADISGEVKVFVKGGWVPQAGGPAGAEEKDVLTLGEPYAMAVRLLEDQPDLSNLLIAPVGYGYHNAVIELTADLENATVSITLVSGELYDTSSNPKTYQIVGGFTNNWSAADAIDFEEVEGVLTATVEDLNGTFKIIQDHAWTNQWATNWETGARLGFNEPYVLGAKTETAEPANLALVNLFGGYHNAVLTLDPETMTLTLVGGEPYRVEADWYVPGSFLGWNCNDVTKFSPVEGQENTYEILLPEFGKDLKIVYGQWMVEFGAAKGSGDTWMLDQDIELATPCDNLNSAYGDQTMQDVTITIVVDYENGAVSLNITSEGDVQPTVYYIKNNWNGEADWTWKQMTPSNNGDEWMFEGVFGGTGVNINTSMSDDGAIWFPVGTPYEGHVIEGDAIEAGQTVRFVYSVSAGTLTATIIETGIENVVLDAVKAQKMLIDGHIYIIRDGRMFNVQGARVR